MTAARTASRLPSGSGSRRFADLKVRSLSAVAAASVGLPLLYLGGVWTMLFVALVIGAMAWEYRSITLHGGGECGPDGAFPLLAVVGGVVVAQFVSSPAGFAWLGCWLVAGAVADLIASRRQAIGWALAGGAYIGTAGIAFLYVRALEPHGFLTVLWLFLIVAAADVGGYFAGRMIGGPKLWPRVSPKKTWAGLGGGVALAFALGGLFSWATTGTYFQQVCAVSAAAALLSQGGDLAESALKRRFGVVNSGRLLPGHGGALDRFDGLIAATLVAALVVSWRGTTVFIW